MGSYVLPRIVADVNERYPAASIALRVSDLNGALQETENGIADFCVAATNQDVASSIFDVEQIGREEIALVRSPADTQIGDRVSRGDLNRLRYVCAPRGLTGRNLIETALRARGVYRRDIRVELGHPEALKYATQRGVGVAFVLLSSVTRELQEGSLRRVQLEDMDIQLPVLLIARIGSRWSPFQRLLAQEIRKVFGATVGYRTVDHTTPSAPNMFS